MRLRCTNSLSTNLHVQWADAQFYPLVFQVRHFATFLHFCVYEIIQQRLHQKFLAVLIPALENPETRSVFSSIFSSSYQTKKRNINPAICFCFRVHAHAASAFLNFCEGVERDTLLSYLNPLVERLLKLLTPAGDPAAASEVIFVKVSMRRCGERVVAYLLDLISLPFFFL
jgi:hypothetical protein